MLFDVTLIWCLFYLTHLHPHYGNLSLAPEEISNLTFSKKSFNNNIITLILGTCHELRFFETDNSHMEADSKHTKIESDSNPGDSRGLDPNILSWEGGEGVNIVREMTHEGF